MNYPVWDVGFGLPLLIVVVAIVHVFIAHFAIGGGLFLVLFESKARRNNDTEMLGCVRLHSRFFMLLTLVMGALTGVGIWFTIGLIHPGATSALIHAFVWFWAAEWVMFFVEITAALVYYYGWDKLDGRTHQKVMWVYFAAAWGSLAVINGIITFMLTPGEWIETGNIWQAFFNPTYFPSLVIRTAITLLMAGLFAFLTGSMIRATELKQRVLRTASIWSLLAIATGFASAVWYWYMLPETLIERISGGWIALDNARNIGGWAVVLLVLGIIISPLLRPRGMKSYEAVVLLALGIVMFGSFEWFREAARKPFVIAEYMYSDGTLIEDNSKYQEAGYLPTIKWKTGGKDFEGEELFNAMCKRCHSLTGYNGLVRFVHEKDWSAEDLSELIPRLEHLRAPMPPFRGTPSEAIAIAEYISKEVAEHCVTQVEITQPDQIWKRNCGLCHTISGFRPLNNTFSDMEIEEAAEVVMIAEELNDAMPPFMGSEEDAAELAEYILNELKSLAVEEE